MKKKINTYYAKLENMGDILNKDIIEKCFGYEVKRKTYLTAELSGIGSGLGNYTFEEDVLKNMLKRVTSPFFPKTHIWGTGFVKYKDEDSKFYKKETKFCAVRGKLSKVRVEKILGYNIDIPLGDAGILASYLLDQRPIMKYDVGIIAHYKEQHHPIFKQLLNKFPNSTLIDVKKTPLEVTKEIAECKVILSSSLHGLIIADSLNIPNRHIVVTNNLLGDGFKFDDYYSAYDLPHEFTDMNIESINSLQYVVDEYKLTENMIEQKKKDMIDCFPYPTIK